MMHATLEGQGASSRCVTLGDEAQMPKGGVNTPFNEEGLQRAS